MGVVILPGTNFMEGKVFVDTNILVYSMDSSFPEKQKACKRALNILWVERRGFLSVQVINEFYVTVTQKLKPGLPMEKAWEIVLQYSAWKPCPIDARTLLVARDAQLRYSLSWWDALVISAASIAQCTTLLSEDLTEGQEYFGVRVVNPMNQNS